MLDRLRDYQLLNKAEELAVVQLAYLQGAARARGDPLCVAGRRTDGRTDRWHDPAAVSTAHCWLAAAVAAAHLPAAVDRRWKPRQSSRTAN
jgi:hypothetical protein